MSDAAIPPLPPELERGAKALRDREPSARFASRLERALAEQAAPLPRRSPRWASLAVAVPALAAAVLVLHGTVGREALEGAEPLTRFEEHHVTLDEAGEAWVELDLRTHEHEGAATVRVDTPASVQVEAIIDADRACGPSRCTHRFVAMPSRAPLRVRVSERGMHSIMVEHASPKKRVRERFLVHAR